MNYWEGKMSKTTNYEISKKLAEIGFRAETGFYWYEYDKGEEMRYIADADGAGKYKAYDLETLLDALPKKLKKYGELGTLFRSGFILGYNLQNFDDLSQLLQYQRQGESLADTAGLLIIWLYEENLIKF
jgi:hypothetical protein